MRAIIPLDIARSNNLLHRRSICAHCIAFRGVSLIQHPLQKFDSPGSYKERRRQTTTVVSCHDHSVLRPACGLFSRIINGVPEWLALMGNSVCPPAPASFFNGAMAALGIFLYSFLYLVFLGNGFKSGGGVSLESASDSGRVYFCASSFFLKLPFFFTATFSLTRQKWRRGDDMAIEIDDG